MLCLLYSILKKKLLNISEQVAWISTSEVIIKLTATSLLRLPETQEALQLPLFYSLFPSHRRFWTDGHQFFPNKLFFVTRSGCGQDRTY